jgi:hypothetical protein
MELKVVRYSASKESTLALFLVNSKFAAYTLEDEKRSVKVWGETRIPAGRYKVELRKEGSHHARYAQKFPDIHKGMLHVTNVPNFEYILIHIGNTDDDTAGCLLVADSAIQNITQDGRLNNSTAAYKRIYPEIANAIENGEDVYITYQDEDFLN